MIYSNTPQQPTNVTTVQTQKDAAAAPFSAQSLEQDGGQQAVRELTLRKLIDGSIKDNESLNITTGVQIMDMRDNHLIADHNKDTEQFAASINKLAVTILVLHDLRAHTLKLDQTLSWDVSDMRAGAGVYDQPGAPTSAKLSDVLFDMLNRSGNTAVRVLVNKAEGGAAQVNHRIKSYPQLQHTYLQPLDANRFYLGNSTAHDSLWIMDQLTAYNDKYARFIKDAMATNIYTDFGVRSQLPDNQDWVLLINKVGILNDPDGDNRHDVGVLYNKKTHHSYGYSFMTTAPEAVAGATQHADDSLKDMGGNLVRFATTKPPKQGQNGVQPFAAQSQPPVEQKILY
jgi:beta-lactamase class A